MHSHHAQEKGLEAAHFRWAGALIIQTMSSFDQ